MAVVGALLEALGIGIIMPALAVLSRPDWIHSQSWLEGVLPAGMLDSPWRPVAFVLSLLLCVAAVRTAFLAALAYAQSRFGADFESSLSTRLLEHYLARPWMFHLQRNSAELVRNIRHEASAVGFVLGARMAVITEAVMLLAIISVLIVLQPVPSIAIGFVLAVLGFAYQRVMHVRVERWGALRLKYEGSRIQHLQQGLGAVRELRLADAAGVFAHRYRRDTEAHLSTVQRHTFASQLPRLLFDLLAILALAVAILLMLLMGQGATDLLPVIGLYAAAATRLLPSVNKLLGALQLVRWGTPSVEVVHAELAADADVGTSSRATTSPGLPTGDIVVADVSFRYPGVDTPALRAVDLHIRTGSMTGIIGASGSGKSTLLDILLGLLQPDAGSVQVGGADIHDGIADWHRRIGYVPQSIYLFDDSLRRNIALGVDDAKIDDAAINRVIRAANLDELVDSWPEGTATRLGERGVRLSGGQRQRIGIARALYADPSILILDEATSALDVETESAVMESILGLHGAKTIIIVAHRLSTVARCDEVYRLEKGQVIARGSFREVVGADSAP
jgi:ABC-type multidrug transport system fused ATPase/permease subunit